MLVLVCAFVAICVAGYAQEQISVRGSIVSVDGEARTIVVKAREGGQEYTVHIAENKKIHLYSKGAREDVVDGADVKVYGKVDVENKKIDEVNKIAVMPESSSYANKTSRVDGVLSKEGDNMFVTNGDNKFALSMLENWTVDYVSAITFADLKPRQSVNFNLVQKDGVYVPRHELRLYGPRPEAQ